MSCGCKSLGDVENLDLIDPYKHNIPISKCRTVIRKVCKLPVGLRKKGEPCPDEYVGTSTKIVCYTPSKEKKSVKMQKYDEIISGMKKKIVRGKERYFLPARNKPLSPAQQANIAKGAKLREKIKDLREKYENLEERIKVFKEGMPEKPKESEKKRKKVIKD